VFSLLVLVPLRCPAVLTISLHLFFQRLAACLFSPDNAAMGFFRYRFCLLRIYHVKITLGNYCLWRAKSPKFEQPWAVSLLPLLPFSPVRLAVSSLLILRKSCFLASHDFAGGNQPQYSWVVLKANAWHGLLEMHLPLYSLFFCQGAISFFSEKWIFQLFLCIKGIYK